MSRPVSAIRNCGPKTDELFAQIGITTAEEVESLGADAVYARLFAHGRKPHFIAYYALVMGLQGRLWSDISAEEKAALRKRFDALAGDSDAPSGIEAELDRIGTGLRR